VDESETGSANFFGPISASEAKPKPDPLKVRSIFSVEIPHLRPPSIAHGVVSFLWAFGLALFIWIGSLAVGVDGATAFIMAAVAGAGIFLFVRICGEERPRPSAARRRDRIR